MMSAPNSERDKRLMFRDFRSAMSTTMSLLVILMWFALALDIICGPKPDDDELPRQSGRRRRPSRSLPLAWHVRPAE